MYFVTLVFLRVTIYKRQISIDFKSEHILYTVLVYRKKYTKTTKKPPLAKQRLPHEKVMESMERTSQRYRIQREIPYSSKTIRKRKV